MRTTLGATTARAVELLRRSVATLAGRPGSRAVRHWPDPPSVSVACLAGAGASPSSGSSPRRWPRREEAVRLAEAIDHRSAVIGALLRRRARSTCLKGDLGAGRLAARATASALRRIWNIAVLRLLVASRPGLRATRCSGASREASPLLAGGAWTARPSGRLRVALSGIAWLGEAYLLAGRLGRGAATLARPALELARGHSERGNEAWALRLLGEIAAHRDPLDAASGRGALPRRRSALADRARHAPPRRPLPPRPRQALPPHRRPARRPRST